MRVRATLRTGTLNLDQLFVTSTNAILAVKGSGKSYTAMVIAEEMLESELPFSVLDPTGAWWGLRCGADGDPRKGLPLLIAGGAHGDVPLRADDGGSVARWLVQNYPAQLLCDLSLLTPDEQHFFALDFANVLFFDNRRAMHVFVDECDEVMPQRPQDKTESACLGAFDRLVRRGRIRGIGLTGITQRSAVMNKNVLTQVGSIIVLRTGSPQDMKAIEGWVTRVLEVDDVKRFLGTLPKLKQGEAWYVSPGRDPIAQRIKVRARRTYDSSRTPEVGEDVVDPDLLPMDGFGLRDFLEAARHGSEGGKGEDDESDDDSGKQFS